jgi:hypothetical protein
MSISYLKNQTWISITREERVFCAELYFQLRNDLKPFLKLADLPINIKYDIGYEVCFYRDILKAYKKSIKASKLPQKRTFDLVLFSEKEIVIIEAKAEGGFDNIQLSSFRNDSGNVHKAFREIGFESNAIKVKLIAICSKKYTPKDKSKEIFEKIITWDEIADIYPKAKDIFYRANEVHE